MTDGRPAALACRTCGCLNAPALSACAACGAVLAGDPATARRPRGALRYIVIGALVCLVTHNLFTGIYLLRRGHILDAVLYPTALLLDAAWGLAFGAALGYAIFRKASTVVRGVLIGCTVGTIVSLISSAVKGWFNIGYSLSAGIGSGLIPGWLIASLVVYENHAGASGRTAMRTAFLKNTGVSLFGILGLICGYLASGTILHSQWNFFFYDVSYSAIELIFRLACLVIGIATVVMSCRRVSSSINVIGIILGLACIGWEVSLVVILVLAHNLLGSP
jgi:hypothetical protein